MHHRFPQAYQPITPILSSQCPLIHSFQILTSLYMHIISINAQDNASCFVTCKIMGAFLIWTLQPSSALSEGFSLYSSNILAELHLGPRTFPIRLRYLSHFPNKNPSTWMDNCFFVHLKYYGSTTYVIIDSNLKL